MQDYRVLTNYNNIKSAIIALFITSSVFAQKKYYPEFNNYGSWSFGGSYYYYQKEKMNPVFGNYTYKPKYMNGFAFSIKKMFNKSGEFSYITGLTLNFNTVYKFSVSLPKEDINSPVFTDDFSGTYKPMDKRMNFSIPFLVQFKKAVGDKSYFNIQTGIDLLYMGGGGADHITIINDANNNEIPRFYYESNSKDGVSLYPNVIISPGFYFMSNRFMYQLNLVYQKAIVPQYEGFMYFDNLKPNGKTFIENKRTGDYLGISVNLFLGR